MFASRSGELGHGALGQARSIGRAGVKRSHATALPAEDRVEFGNRGALVGGAGRTDFADAMRALLDASGVAGVAEQIAERLLGEWLASLAADEGEISTRSGAEDIVEHRQDRNGDRDPVLFGPYRSYSVSNVLPTKTHRIAAPQSRVEQHAEPHPLFRADRPSRLVFRDVFFRPYREAGALTFRWVFDASGRIYLDVPGIGCPTEKSSHRVDEMPGLRWCLPAAITPVDDVGAVDHGRGHGARSLEHRAHDVLALSAGGERQRGPRRRLAVAIPKPFKRPDRRFLALNPDRSAIERRAVFRLELRGAEFGPDADPRSMPAPDVPCRPAVAADFTLQAGRARSWHVECLQDDFVLGGLRIVGVRYRRRRHRHILQHHGYHAIGMHFDALRTSLLGGADSAGDIGLCDRGWTSGHGALSVANDTFHTPTGGLPSSSKKLAESSNKFV